MVDDQHHTNQFAEVHRKVKIFKDLLRDANKHDADLREKAKETIDGETHLKGAL